MQKDVIVVLLESIGNKRACFHKDDSIRSATNKA